MGSDDLLIDPYMELDGMPEPDQGISNNGIRPSRGDAKVSPRATSRKSRSMPKPTTHLDGKANWTPAEGAEWLGVKERMVRRLIQERKLPYVKVGRHVRLRPEDVKTFRDQQVRPAIRSRKR